METWIMVIDKISETVQEYLEKLNLPGSQVSPIVQNFKIDGIGVVIDATDDQLSELLVFYGSWKAFLDATLSALEADKAILSETFTEGIFAGYYKLHKEYFSRHEKQPIKDVVRGEILATNPTLNKVKKDLMTTEAKVIYLKGVRESYKTLYDTVSRVVALRLRGKMDE